MRQIPSVAKTSDFRLGAEIMRLGCHRPRQGAVGPTSVGQRWPRLKDGLPDLKDEDDGRRNKAMPRGGLGRAGAR